MGLQLVFALSGGPAQERRLRPDLQSGARRELEIRALLPARRAAQSGVHAGRSQRPDPLPQFLHLLYDLS